MKLVSLKKFLILSLLLHASIAVLLQSSFLFVSDSPTYTSFEVTSSISKPMTTPKPLKTVSVSKTKEVKTQQVVPESKDSSSFENTTDLPAPVDGKSVTQGLMPLNLDETDTDGTEPAKKAIERIKKAFPSMPIKTVDERFTSKMAKTAMIEMGMKKKDRQVKGNVDVIAAAIMLQEYMGVS